MTYILLSSHNLIANIGSVVLNTSDTSDYNTVNLSSKKKLNWEMVDFMEFEIFSCNCVIYLCQLKMLTDFTQLCDSGCFL